MDVVLAIILFVVGLLLIIKGGDWFVDAASWIAEKFGIPTFIIGATIVSIATTLPELLVSVIAAAGGSSEMAIGNAVGSVTANTGLIMGISMICLPTAINRKDYGFKGILLIVTCALLYVLCLNGILPVWGAFVVLICCVVFMTENVFAAKKEMPKGKELSDGMTEVKAEAEEKDEKSKKSSKREVVFSIGKFIIGAAGIVGGAQLLVTYGQKLAYLIGIPESIVALTMVAIGTSLPELVTTITAIKKKEAGLSVGNIIGANIIDLSLILPVCAFVGAKNGGLTVSPLEQTLYLDFPVCLGLTLIAIVPTLVFGKYRRWQGILLCGLYVAYVVVLCLGIF